METSSSSIKTTDKLSLLIQLYRYVSCASESYHNLLIFISEKLQLNEKQKKKLLFNGLLNIDLPTLQNIVTNVEEGPTIDDSITSSNVLKGGSDCSQYTPTWLRMPQCIHTSICHFLEISDIICLQFVCRALLLFVRDAGTVHTLHLRSVMPPQIQTRMFHNLHRLVITDVSPSLQDFALNTPPCDVRFNCTKKNKTKTLHKASWQNSVCSLTTRNNQLAPTWLQLTNVSKAHFHGFHIPLFLNSKTLDHTKLKHLHIRTVLTPSVFQKILLCVNIEKLTLSHLPNFWTSGTHENFHQQNLPVGYAGLQKLKLLQVDWQCFNFLKYIRCFLSSPVRKHLKVYSVTKPSIRESIYTFVENFFSLDPIRRYNIGELSINAKYMISGFPSFCPILHCFNEYCQKLIKLGETNLLDNFVLDCDLKHDFIRGLKFLPLLSSFALLAANSSVFVEFPFEVGSNNKNNILEDLSVSNFHNVHLELTCYESYLNFLRKNVDLSPAKEDNITKPLAEMRQISIIRTVNFLKDQFFPKVVYMLTDSDIQNFRITLHYHNGLHIKNKSRSSETENDILEEIKSSIIVELFQLCQKFGLSSSMKADDCLFTLKLLSNT